MKNKILILVIIVCSSWICLKKDKFDLTTFRIEYQKWICSGTFMDTIYNPDFRPNPILFLQNSIAVSDTFQLGINLSDILIDTVSKTIQLRGVVGGGWLIGHGSEVLIMTAVRLDTVVEFGILPNDYFRKYVSLDTIDCVVFRDFDFCYTDFGLKGKKEYRKVDCELNYKANNDILFFGLDNCYAELFDLKRIITKYEHSPNLKNK